MKKRFLIFVTSCLLFVGCKTASASLADRTLKGNSSNSSAPVKAIAGGQTSLFSAANRIKENVADRSAGSILDLQQEGSLSTNDFTFFDNVIANGIPSDAEFPAVMYAEGEWKYCMRVSGFEELGYADMGIDYNREVLILTLHPRWISDGYESYPETDEEVGYDPFEGTIEDDGVLHMPGNNVDLCIEAYYAYSGREYMLGGIYANNQYYGDFMMTRGQE